MNEDTTTETQVAEGAEQSTTPETIERSAESLRSDQDIVAAPAEEQEDDTEAEQSTTSQDDQTSTDDQELQTWAEKAGYDPNSDPKVLKALRDTQKKLHETTSQVSELKKTVTKESDGSDEAVIKEARILNYYNSNPDARQYDQKMGEIYSRFTQSDPEFAEHLLRHLDTLHAMAKAEDSEAKVIEARQKGKEEAIQQTKKAQASSAPKANAVSSAPQKTEMNAERIREIISAGQYEQHRDEILAWERSNYGL